MRDTAYFAAGCFWGIEAAFRAVEGVVETAVGYMGGQKEQPTYREVCTDTTGHAEAVEVVYDPNTVTYGQLLDVFWGNHDPTQVNRQGPDHGSQYRSAVFVADAVQRIEAEQAIRNIEATGRYQGRKVATQVVPVAESGPFWRAEEYHQRYFEKNGHGACKIATTIAEP